MFKSLKTPIERISALIALLCLPGALVIPVFYCAEFLGFRVTLPRDCEEFFIFWVFGSIGLGLIAYLNSWGRRFWLKPFLKFLAWIKTGGYR